MAILKCKMCGGTLELNEGDKTAMCAYCGNRQTVPSVTDEVITNLFNRANNLRLKSEFDKAAEIYGKILNNDDKISEAHWGLVLCKYGIEYVEDPKTYKRIPTCHRTQYVSVLSDADYLAAIENADAVSRELYVAQAHEIAELQKSILAIVKDEKPFDVFICYKETDESGKRTVDSTLANDIYYQLTKEGLRVFYAAITLEDKLGVEYEPYIFAALNSAKVMLVIGTKPEYFEAVWVKNEWSRYLAIMKNDREKLLIPCYRDMDAYDLPEEFAHLQAQDMSKIGFINDLVRGIKKVIGKNAPKKEIVTTSGVINVETFLKRAFMFLEDREWQNANSYAEKILDVDPENPEAYLVKLLAEMKTTEKERLKYSNICFDDSNNYKKIQRFGTEKLKAELKNYIVEIKSRKELERLTTIYEAGIEKRKNAIKESDFLKAAEIFESIIDFKDAASHKNWCIREANEAKIKAVYDMGVEALEAATNEVEYLKAAEIFKRIIGFKDAELCWNQCLSLALEEKNKVIYDGALNLVMEGGIAKYEEAISYLQPISGWKDEKGNRNVDDLIQKYKNKIEHFARQKAKEKRRMRIKNVLKILPFATVLIALLVSSIVLLNKTKITKENAYNEAEVLYEKGNYGQAAIEFGKLGDYKDSVERSKEIWEIIVQYQYIDTSMMHSVAVTDNGNSLGTEYIGKKYYGQCAVESWENIKSVSAGYYHTVGLMEHGKVVSTIISDGVDYGQDDVGNWNNIIAVAAGKCHTVGIVNGGSVVAVGSNECGQCEVYGWKDITAISAGNYHTVGLTKDGNVVSTKCSGENCHGQCEVDEWTDIIAISAGNYHTVGLRSDGTVVSTGDKSLGRSDVGGWTDIVAISAGYNHTVGLKIDGTVVAVGLNETSQCDVDGWTDIVAISAGNTHTVGLKSDGTVVAVGDNEYGQCDVSSWTDIKLP